MHSISENKLIKELSLLVICTLALSLLDLPIFPCVIIFVDILYWHFSPRVWSILSCYLSALHLMRINQAEYSLPQKPALHHIVSRLQTKSLLL